MKSNIKDFKELVQKMSSDSAVICASIMDMIDISKGLLEEMKSEGVLSRGNESFWLDDLSHWEADVSRGGPLSSMEYVFFDDKIGSVIYIDGPCLRRAYLASYKQISELSDRNLLAFADIKHLLGDAIDDESWCELVSKSDQDVLRLM